MIEKICPDPIQGGNILTQADATERMNLRVTDWGEVLRLDVNQLGASIPAQFLLAEKGGVADEQKKAWSESQADGILEALENSARNYGGNFCSFAEWTAVCGTLYPASMREKRKAKFGGNYRAAISSLNWLNRESGLSGYIQASAYIPKSKDSSFKQEMWRPKCMADYEMFVVAPAVTTWFGGVRLLHVAGMLGMDSNGSLVYADSPEKQVQHILENIISVYEEAGGSRTDVVRLRPFVQTPEIASIVRRKVKELWKGSIEPAIFMSDGMRFGGPDDKQYAEIQVFGILPGDTDIEHRKLDILLEGSDRDALTIRSTAARDFEYFQASEIRAGQDCEPETEARQVVDQVEEFLSKTGLSVNDVCNIMVYAGTLKAAERMEEAIEKSSIERNMVHLIPCPPMPEMNGRQLKAEVTARRLLR